MVYMNFSAREVKPIAVDFMLTPEIQAAVKAAGEKMCATLRDRLDYDTAAFFMTRTDGAWFGLESAQVEIMRHSERDQIVLGILRANGV